MEWISNWAQGIVVAVIIATIIEMILPEGNSKKYIKVVIGVYILFTIISPVITKITGKSFQVSDILNLNEYIETSKNTNAYENLEDQNNDQIKEIYKNSLKNDMKEKIEAKQYLVKAIQVEVADNQEYTIQKIEVEVIKKQSETEATKEENTTNAVNSVNEIKIEIRKLTSYKYKFRKNRR